MFIRSVSLAVIFVLSGCSGTTNGTQELVFTNGFVYSFSWGEPGKDGTPARDAPFENGIWYPDAEAIYISGDMILYVGTNEGALSQARKNVRVIDVQGATIIPGAVHRTDHFQTAERALEKADSITTHRDFFTGQTSDDDSLFASLYRAIAGNESEARADSVSTPEQAIRMYTVWPATVSGILEHTGTIEAGKWADLTILSIDPLNIDFSSATDGEDGPDSDTGVGIKPADLLDGEIVMTIVAGQIVYDRKNQPENV